MSPKLRRSRANLCASLSLPILVAVGCSSDGTVTSPAAVSMAKGNWQISSSAASAAALPVLSGQLSDQAGTVTGTLHAQAASSCVSPQTSFSVSGSADANNLVTLNGSIAGGTFSLTGSLAEDGRSLENASYTVTGGACAFVARGMAVVQAFNPITGNYAGTFSDADSQLAQISANFSQSSTPDANGNFTLAGIATLPNNPCFPTTVPVSNTQVTGGTFTFTYAYGGSSVTANGTFSSDATTLTVTSWQASGTCGTDTGVQSTMTKH